MAFSLIEALEDVATVVAEVTDADPELDRGSLASRVRLTCCGTVVPHACTSTRSCARHGRTWVYRMRRR